MMGIAKQYVQLELPAFALTCLTLMPHSEKRHQQIKVSCACVVPLRLPGHTVYPSKDTAYHSEEGIFFHQTRKAWILGVGEAG